MSVTMILMAAKDLRGMNYVLTTHSLLNRVRKVNHSRTFPLHVLHAVLQELSPSILDAQLSAGGRERLARWGSDVEVHVLFFIWLSCADVVKDFLWVVQLLQKLLALSIMFAHEHKLFAQLEALQSNPGAIQAREIRPDFEHAWRPQFPPRFWLCHGRSSQTA